MRMVAVLLQCQFDDAVIRAAKPDISFNRQGWDMRCGKIKLDVDCLVFAIKWYIVCIYYGLARRRYRSRRQPHGKWQTHRIYDKLDGIKCHGTKHD